MRLKTHRVQIKSTGSWPLRMKRCGRGRIAGNFLRPVICDPYKAIYPLCFEIWVVTQRRHHLLEQLSGIYTSKQSGKGIRISVLGSRVSLQKATSSGSLRFVPVQAYRYARASDTHRSWVGPPQIGRPTSLSRVAVVHSTYIFCPHTQQSPRGPSRWHRDHHVRGHHERFLFLVRQRRYTASQSCPKGLQIKEQVLSTSDKIYANIKAS
jgi:hypothetical protein